MKRIFIKLLSITLCAVTLLSLCSCAVLDKITSNIEDKPTDDTTKVPDSDVIPTVKYKRCDLKYTFLTVVEGEAEGTPAQISYSVLDTGNNTLTSLMIPVNTFVSGSNGNLGAEMQVNYFSKNAEGRGASVAYACEMLMERLENDLLLPCDYYMYFDKTSLSDLVNELGGVKVSIPFEMSFSDGVVIPKGESTLDGESFWKVMCYGSYKSGSELNAAKLLWTSVFYKLKEQVSSDTISLFMLNVRGNLETDVPKTNGVDVFFLRKLLSLDGALYKFVSVDVQILTEGTTSFSVICKNALVQKINSFMVLYETEIEAEDFDPELGFGNSGSAAISAAYNSTVAPSYADTAEEIAKGKLNISSK